MDERSLASGEPLAYVIGWVPFLSLKIFLESSEEEVGASKARALIPRPETEWWTEKLIDHLKYRFDDRPFKLLDLCSGSGAIGLAVLAAFPHTHVYFGEVDSALESLIQKNIKENNLDEMRANIRIGDLFTTFENEHFDIVATNPPYIPQTSEAVLEKTVTDFEPHQALFSGPDGLDVIRKITKEAPQHLSTGGELWMECDISNIGQAQQMLPESTIHIDQYGRPRLIVALFE